MIKVAAWEQHRVNHPEHDYPGPDILVFREPASRMACGGLHARNAVVMSNNVLDWARPETWTGMIDRSPCGTGTSARVAQLVARGEMTFGEELTNESIIGTHFIGKAVHETTVANYPAIVPTITGRAWITGTSQHMLAPDDPFPRGFRL